MSFTLDGPDYAAIADLIGLTTLRARYPALTGAGVTVGQVEGSSSGTEGGIDFEVDPASLGHPADNADHFITYFNGTQSSFAYDDNVLGSFSNHATVQASFFYNPTPYLGAPKGVAPGVAHVDNYSAAGFLDNLAAGPLPDKVVNLSVLYLGADVGAAFNAAANLGNTVFVAAAGNGGTPGMPSSAYNVISVDTWPGVQAVGPALNGVPKPDISAPQTVTSRATAIVSGAATLLVQAGEAGYPGATAQNLADAVDFRTIKALLLNGASKPADYYTTSYAPTAEQPLNAVYGAGVVNVLASVGTLLAGEQAPSAVRDVASATTTFAPLQGSALASSGWSLATASSAAGRDAVHDYLLALTAGTRFIATLTWAADDNSAIDHLDLLLFDEANGTQIAGSTSGISNVQQIDITPDHDGSYDLSVRLHGDAFTGRSEIYALAFAPASPVACFAQGTRIATGEGEGEVAVETLQIGHHVRSAFGGTVPVVWIGWRRVDCRHHPRPHDVWPIRVRKDAFAPGQPARDLLLSPDHAVHVQNVLIPVRYLVNGTTIRQEAVAEVTYLHVELPSHDVIYADGLAVESYLDTGNRAAFANGSPVVAAHPDFALRVWEAEACAVQ
ncbi:MAG: Hint domain-containing protein, partial [Alphaproteobacteria bacterium]|nr:Hint domain-containing protein [Alphaproteobacteria bacterium]